jgi:hypothetical protein
MAKVTQNELRSAKPRLLCVVEGGEDERTQYLSPYISDVDLGWDELIDEGFDSGPLSPLGPVYWRIVERAGERFYLSTFMATRAHVTKAWGPAGLAYCDPITGVAIARVETRLGRAAQDTKVIETPSSS